MAGSTLNFNSLFTLTYGWFWLNLAIPGAGARITLHTDGTPESVANPSAKHLGHTTEGWELKAVPSSEKAFFDESIVAIKTVPGTMEASIAGNLGQTIDLSAVLQYIVQGFGTYSTAAGYEQITIGTIPIVYTASALIWPLENDATKFGVYNLYRSINNAGLANQVKRRAVGSNPVVFEGFAVTSRAVADQVGKYWKTIA